VGSGTLLILLPKCPMCIAAYLGLWMGADVAMSVAMHRRHVREILFTASALLLVVLAWRYGRVEKSHRQGALCTS
jgi:hypothetical protein